MNELPKEMNDRPIATHITKPKPCRNLISKTDLERNASTKIEIQDKHSLQRECLSIYYFLLLYRLTNPKKQL